MHIDQLPPSPSLARVLAGHDPELDIDWKGLKTAAVSWAIGLLLLLFLALLTGAGEATVPQTEAAAPESAPTSTR